MRLWWQVWQWYRVSPGARILLLGAVLGSALGFEFLPWQSIVVAVVLECPLVLGVDARRQWRGLQAQHQHPPLHTAEWCRAGGQSLAEAAIAQCNAMMRDPKEAFDEMCRAAEATGVTFRTMSQRLSALPEGVVERFPRYPHGAERTVDVQLVSGRQVRIWVDAQAWSLARTRYLGQMLSSNAQYQKMSAEELVDAMAGHDAVNAVQVTDPEDGFRLGAMAYLVPFTEES